MHLAIKAMVLKQREVAYNGILDRGELCLQVSHHKRETAECGSN
jgi:ribosomal protein S24E